MIRRHSRVTVANLHQITFIAVFCQLLMLIDILQFAKFPVRTHQLEFRCSVIEKVICIGSPCSVFCILNPGVFVRMLQ